MAKDDHSFTPGNDSLLDRYLRARLDGNISGLADACLFHDADVCSVRPHDLVRDRTPARVPCRDAGDGQQWFFFSPARFVGQSTTKRSRTVDGSNGKESWHAEGSPKPVEGSAGGQLQKFSYHIRTVSGSVEKPGWIMTEYSFKGTRAGDLVLCKVYKSPRGPGRSSASSSSSSTSSAKSGTKRKAADDDDHLEAATPSTRPRQADQDDVMLFVEPVPQLAPATVGGITTLQELEAFLMAEDDDDWMTYRSPEDEDRLEYYMRFFSDNHDEQVTTIDDQQCAAAAIQSAYHRTLMI